MNKPLKIFLIILAVGFVVRAGTAILDQSSNQSNRTTSATEAKPAEPTPANVPPTPAQQKKLDAEYAAAQEQLRLGYAKFTEDNLLRAGYDVDVTAYGPKHKYLKLKWVLASKVLAFQFSEQNGEMFKTMKGEGFTKFVITDGYDETWYWDLTK